MAAEQPVKQNRVKDHAGVGEPVAARVKTKRMMSTVREALGIPRPDKSADQKIRKSPRLAVRKPFSYRTIENDIVLPDTYSGTMLNIGYHGMMAELDRPLPAHTQIKLRLDALLDHAKSTDTDADAAELYARIIDTRLFNGRHVSGLEFTCVSSKSEKLLMHAMMHFSDAGNALLDEHLWQHERETTTKINVLQITKRIILATLLVGSAAVFYLVWVLNDALVAVS